MCVCRRNAVITFVIVIFVLFILLQRKPTFLAMQKLESTRMTYYHLKTTSYKTIQWFDAEHNGHGLRMKAKNVRMEKCKYKNCRLLQHYIVPNDDNRQQNALDADAVIFQGTHLGLIQPPARRDSDQVFVFAERETWWYRGPLERMLDRSLNKSEKQQQVLQNSASTIVWPDVFQNPRVYLNTFRFLGLFNWTMTYRRDSDIPLLYGEIYPNVSSAKSKKDFPSSYIQSSTLPKNYNKIYMQKKFEIVWLVSDCITKSNREKYVLKLRQYIPVDIYGGCGPRKCPKGKYPNNHEGSCLDRIISSYKFILSFENTFHTDYVTEKLFDWFGRDIIQVVYGLANYSAITPPGTVINAADFNSPEKLANYLHRVGSDKGTYTEYLKRKDNYFAVGHDVMQQKAYCQLCEKLNNLDKNRRTYTNVAAWWQLNDTTGFERLMTQALGHNVSDTDFAFNVILVTFSVFIFVCLSCLYSKVCRYIKSFL